MRVLVLLAIGMSDVVHGWAMVSGTEVEVKRTTVPGVPEGTVGAFDLTGTDALVWRSGSGAVQRTVAMPYKGMVSFVSSQRLARHLGVAPAIAAGLVRKRERKHYFMFTWKDEKDTMQVLEVEVSKESPRGLLAVLRARAPNACVPVGAECGVDKTGDGS